VYHPLLIALGLYSPNHNQCTTSQWDCHHIFRSHDLARSPRYCDIFRQDASADLVATNPATPQHYSRPITTWSGSLGRFTQILTRVIDLGTRASSTVSPSTVDTTTVRFGVSNRRSNAAKLPGSTSRAGPSVTSVSPSWNMRQATEIHDGVDSICAPLTGSGATPPSGSEMNSREFGGATFVEIDI
jgi:hypothetical protein